MLGPRKCCLQRETFTTNQSHSNQKYVLELRSKSLHPLRRTRTTMAWPCISRVCCLAQFWNQFDKSDLSVPLTIQNYSDIADREIRSVTGNVFAERAQTRDHATPDHRDSSAAQDGGGNRVGRRRAEPSSKPHEDVPFPSVTQYKQDYKPWPIPKKDNFPWISNGVGKSSPVKQQHPARAGKEERAGRQRHAENEAAKTSSYREEYKSWAGVQPSKPILKRPTFLGMTTTEPPPETSYQAAFSADTQRHANVSVPDMTTRTQPNIAEMAGRPEVSSRPEEQLVRTKLSPNPSAVFQSRSRIFNI
ncbi:MAP6 domain-containing protein 1 isoform X2 [Ictalurus furcatus]|uniref:MAP6 domain-containing protein 1 isoform X2 n=1 Tax=Ictalurus furcatus TaxID=66913 RepID=UPI00235016EF|nr:MAP6 domain-containing protein 1 isoform X2 [Ictalurus furcatus]